MFQTGALDTVKAVLLTSALECGRRLEHMPQWLRADLARSRHVIADRNEIVALVFYCARLCLLFEEGKKV